MHSYRLMLIGLATMYMWLCVALPIFAQSHLPPLDEEQPPLPTWPEQSIEAQLQKLPDEALIRLPATPMRSFHDSAGMGMGGMGGGPMGGPGGGSPFSAFTFFQPQSNLQNQSGTFQVRGEGLVLGLPVSMGPNGIWILNTRVEHNAFETDATLPGSTQPFPHELWNINLGLMHIHPLDNGWTAGGMVSIGSASDRPFASIREMNANLLAFLNVPTRERDAWNFSLFYSPLGQLAFPIPGIAYLWRPNEQFQMSIGLPFSLTYRPTDTISLNLSYLPLTNASAIVCWTPSELWTVYSGYQNHSQGYELAGRADPQERLFDFDQRLNVGVRRALGAGFALDCSAAYLFDRSYFRSESFFGDVAERLRVDPGAQLMLKLQWDR
jgi:hypothetical protein